MTDDIGRMLHRRGIRLERLIDDGGMGRVFVGRTSVGLEVAVKKLAPDLSRHASIRRRFRSEAEFMAQLKHPNIVKASDCFEEDGDLFIVMDLIEGESLEHHLARTGPLSLAQVWELLSPVCDAIEYAHDHGVIHRDLKPANIMLDASTGRPVPKILDFGIAKLLDERREQHSHHTVMGSRLGTPGYMSPEQELDSAQIDGRTDVYALGVIAYRMALGRLPRDEKAHYTAPSALRPELGPGFDTLIERALEHDRNRRIASAAHFASALHQLALAVDDTARTGPYPPIPRPVTATVHETAPRPVSLVVPVQPTSVVGATRADQSSVRTMLLGAIVVLLIALVAVLWMSNRKPTAAGTAEAPTCDGDTCAPGRICRDGRCLPPNMIWVDRGRFTMGDGCMDNNPPHDVSLSGFAIDTTVSDKAVSETHDWHAARRRCRSRGAGFDLPTEAQWAYAVNRGRIAPASRAEWVRDWYHEDHFRSSDGALDPLGPTEDQCQQDPGTWADSKHRAEAGPCCKVVRGYAYGACDATQARSFYGPSVPAEIRGFRCVWTP